MVVAATVAAVLAPWCIILAHTLPTSAVAMHWSTAWVGLDAAEGAAALVTYWFIRRRSAYAALSSAMGAALLLADAWFDMCTSPAGMEQLLAVLEAVLIEIPLACAALRFAATTPREASPDSPRSDVVAQAPLRPELVLAAR